VVGFLVECCLTRLSAINGPGFVFLAAVCTPAVLLLLGSGKGADRPGSTTPCWLELDRLGHISPSSALPDLVADATLDHHRRRLSDPRLRHWLHDASESRTRTIRY